MLQGNGIQQPVSGFFTRGVVLSMLLVTGLATALMMALPAASMEEGSVKVISGATFFFLALCLGLGSAVVQRVNLRQMVYKLALITWGVLLLCTVYFSRVNDAYSMGQGGFSLLAYGEAAMWILCFIVLMVLTARKPAYLRQLVTGAPLWVTLFVGFCVVSIAWAPGAAYALAWGFKVVLTVGLLQLCASLMEDVNDVAAFLKTTVFAFFFLSVVPVYYAFTDPTGPWEDDRLAANPDLLSPTAASLMLMSMILFSLTKKRIFVFTGVVGAAVMCLAFGKAGIVGGMLGATIYILLQKKVIKSLGMLLGMGALILFIISVTPLSSYLQTYRGGSTLTGRTTIWATAINAIKTKPIFGHGYLGTYFSWENTSGLESGAVHLHNGFLEVAYNDGAIGELLLLMVHFMIVKNLFKSIKLSKIIRNKDPDNQEAWRIYLVTIGSLAIYIHSFLQGLFGADFGGRCMSPYMLFLAVFVIADVCRRLNEKLLARMSRAPEPLYANPTFSSLEYVPVRD
jgi:hypothetical protein